MAGGINKVILIGRLGKDPEVRYMPNGNAVANITLATSESWKDKNTGQQQEKTEWHRIVIYRRLAEIAGEYLKKGAQIYLEGKLQTRKWTDQQGQDRYTTEIVCNEFQMIGSRGAAPSGAAAGPAAAGDQQASMQQGDGAAAPSANSDGFDEFDEDIPF